MDLINNLYIYIFIYIYIYLFIIKKKIDTKLHNLFGFYLQM